VGGWGITKLRSSDLS